MGAHIIKVDPSGDYGEAVRKAGKVLREGGLVVFPTETVYGLAARADLPKAMARLRQIKGRDSQKAFTVHLARRDEAQWYVDPVPGLAQRLIRKTWPGPLTIIVDVANPLASAILVGRSESTSSAIFYENTVGIRCPDDAIAQELLKEADGPVVAASANRAGQPPPWTGDDVLHDLGSGYDVLIESGRTKYAQPSTIVHVHEGGYEFLRGGVLDAGTIERLSILRLLFVCTGNTCRSPMAAGLTRKMLAERFGGNPSSLEERGIVVLSAGTSGGVGPASAGALAVMARRGVDLSDHQSAALKPELIHQSDYIFAMTQSHRDTVLSMSPLAEGRVRLLLDTGDVHDPMGSAEEVYERCAQTIEEGLKDRLREIAI